MFLFFILKIFLWCQVFTQSMSFFGWMGGFRWPSQALNTLKSQALEAISGFSFSKERRSVGWSCFWMDEFLDHGVLVGWLVGWLVGLFAGWLGMCLDPEMFFKIFQADEELRRREISIDYGYIVSDFYWLPMIFRFQGEAVQVLKGCYLFLGFFEGILFLEGIFVQANYFVKVLWFLEFMWDVVDQLASRMHLLHENRGQMGAFWPLNWRTLIGWRFGPLGVFGGLASYNPYGLKKICNRYWHVKQHIEVIVHSRSILKIHF